MSLAMGCKHLNNNLGRKDYDDIPLSEYHLMYMFEDGQNLQYKMQADR